MLANIQLLLPSVLRHRYSLGETQLGIHACRTAEFGKAMEIAVLIWHGDKVLLARQTESPDHSYAPLQGHSSGYPPP